MFSDLRASWAYRTLGAALAACAAAASLLLVTPELSAAAKAPAKSGPEVTFCGFQAQPGGGGTIFVELSELVVVQVSHAGQVFEYKLVGASVPLRNNRNPLLLGEFGTSALSAVLVPAKPAKGKGRGAKLERSVKLVVTLRGPGAPTYKLTPHGKGAALEVQLPPPSR